MNRAAGFVIRARAFCWDYVIILSYLMALTLVFVCLRAVLPAVSAALFATATLGHLSSFVLLTLPVASYFLWLEASPAQATWGKRRVGLKVMRRDGRRLRLGRSALRTAAKLLPWELAHTAIWTLWQHPEADSPLATLELVLTWVLVAANLVSLNLSQTRQTLYDRLADSVVSQEAIA